MLLIKLEQQNMFLLNFCTIFFSFKKTTHQLLLHRPGGFVNILQVTTTYYLLNIFCFSSRFIINDFAKQKQKKNLLFVFSYIFFIFKERPPYSFNPAIIVQTFLVYYNWGLIWSSN